LVNQTIDVAVKRKRFARRSFADLKSKNEEKMDRIKGKKKESKNKSEMSCEKLPGKKKTRSFPKRE